MLSWKWPKYQSFPVLPDSNDQKGYVDENEKSRNKWSKWPKNSKCVYCIYIAKLKMTKKIYVFPDQMTKVYLNG